MRRGGKGRGRGRRPPRHPPAHPQSSERRQPAALRVLLVFFGFCGALDVSNCYFLIIFKNNDKFVFTRVWNLFLEVNNKLNLNIAVWTFETKCSSFVGCDWRCSLHLVPVPFVCKTVDYTWMVVFSSSVLRRGASSVTSDCCRGKFPWRKLSKRA